VPGYIAFPERRKHLKKPLLLAALLCSALVLMNCGLFGSRPDFFPTTVGSTWTYQGWMTYEQVDDPDTLFTTRTKTEVTEKTTLFSGEEVSEFVNTDSTHTFVPFETTSVNVSRSYVRQDGDYILAYDSKDDAQPDTALALPLEEGKTWTIYSNADTSVTALVLKRETVTVAAGEFKDCWKLEVTISTGGLGQKTYWWYADGIGRVRNYVESTNSGIKTVLENELVSSDVK
jgi:hypothetical protein